MFQQLKHIFLLIIISFFLNLPMPSVAASDDLVLAVHPYLPVSDIKKRFTPLGDYLSKSLGRKVSIRVGGNYEEHINAIGKDQVDIAFLGPAGYIHLVRGFGAKPLLARFEVNHEPYLYGVIAVRYESNIKELAQLRDKRFAFGDPESTMSHVVPRYMLMQEGIPRGLPKDYEYLGSHKNVALGVLAGDFTAGAMKKEVFDEFKDRGLRALATSPGVPDHVFVTRADMPVKDIDRMQQLFLELKDQENGPAILKQLHHGLTALVPTNDSDYDELREMLNVVESSS